MGILLSRCSYSKSRCYHAPIWLGGNRGGPVVTPQNDRQGETSISWMEESVDEVLSIPETQSDRLSFPNLQGTAEEEEDEEEEDDVEEDEEEVEEDNDEEGNVKEGSQDEGDDGDKGEEDKKREDVE